MRECAFCTEPAVYEVLVHPGETAAGWTFEETWEDACEDHADPYTYTRVIEEEEEEEE